MLLIFNLQAYIVLGISLLAGMLLQVVFPHIGKEFEVLIWAVPLTGLGYIFELLQLRPRMFFIPTHIAGGFLLVINVLKNFGIVIFLFVLILLLLLSWAVKIVEDYVEWTNAKKSLNEYESMGEENPDAHEVFLMKALFQNNWIPGTKAHFEHNAKVVNYFFAIVCLNFLQRKNNLSNFCKRECKIAKNLLNRDGG